MRDFRAFLAATLLVSSFAPSAVALDAETADLVTSYTVEVPRSFRIDEDDGTVFVGADDCESMLENARISVVFATQFNPQTQSSLIEEVDMFTVARDSTARVDCLNGELCVPVDMEDFDYTTSGVAVDIAFADLLAVGEFTTCADFDQEFFVRLIVEDSLMDSSTTENADARIIVDAIRPSAPSGLTAAATENTLVVEFEASADADINRYFVYWSTTPFDGGQDPDSLTLERKPLGEEPSGTVSVSLDAGADLYVAVVAEDLAGNLSDLSGVVQASVVETNDFWEQYKKAGGAEDGGCSTTRGASPVWFAFATFAVVALGRRRRRRQLAGAAGALALCAGLSAPLDVAAETPIWGAMELKLGGYYPAIDDEFGGTGPFGEVFGTKNLMLGELEVDGWLWQGFGKLGIGGHLGFSRVKGGAVATEETTGEGAEVEDTTAFSVIPMRASLIYRFDWLAQNTKIPISAGVKVGPDFYRWRVTTSNRETASFDGDVGAGWKRGWHFAAGLQLLLDFIDPSTAAAFDLSWGVNNSYLFVEFMATKVDDFGGAGLDLSDNLWLFGLSFEF